MGVKWLGFSRCTLTKIGSQPTSKVSKILKAYTNGIILEVGDQACVFRHGATNEI